MFKISLEEKKAKEAEKPKKSEPFKPWKVKIDDPPAPPAKREPPKDGEPVPKVGLKKGGGIKKPISKTAVIKEEPKPVVEEPKEEPKTTKKPFLSRKKAYDPMAAAKKFII